MTARYKVSSGWVVIREQGPCVIETADLTDTRTGHVYEDGAYRVRMTRKLEGWRTKTFKGESAWSAADCYARDAVFAERFAQ